LAEATPLAEHDLARWFAALDPWRDTLALWLLSAEPQATSRLRDMIFSLALRYGAIAARDGLVRGVRYPFHRQALVSANAALAAGLWRCGIYPSVIPALVNYVAGARAEEGGWSDEGQPADPLTTLAAADLLSRLDPGFDPAATIGWFARRQEPAGWWRALNPEVPWLTAAIASWLEHCERPFAERFEWPSSPIWSRDRLSGLTTVATLEELELMLDGLPRLRDRRVELAFLDLAGFGAWNNAHGQAAGDRVIALLGRTLGDLPGVLPVRIGGDEFLLLGKPAETAGALEATLDAWRRAWPRHLGASGADHVAPRIVVGAAKAHALPQLRRELGEAIASLKADCPRPPAKGVLRRWSGHLLNVTVSGPRSNL
jgi:GGDEF domain-containing protein